MVVAGRGTLAVRSAQLFAMLMQLHGGFVLECLPSPGDGDPRRRLDSLRAAALRNGWPCHDQLTDIALGPEDLLLSVQYQKVIPMAELGGARALNLHFAALPRHRGSLSCYWPIAGRDADAGVTLHEIAAAVDAGPIVAQRTFPLPEFVTAGELFQLFELHGFELITEQAAAIIGGTYRSTPQPSGGPAHRRRDVDFTDREICDFDRPAAEVRDRCLALIYAEFQLPNFQGRAIERAYMLSPAPTDERPGAVLARTDRSVVVRCLDGMVCFEFAS